MEKIDVAIQSYKKPESMVYTLLSLKKYCGSVIDTIYINDDCSGGDTISHYLTKELKDELCPLKIIVRENSKPSGYTHTIVTKEVFFKKPLIKKIQLLGHFAIGRAKWYKTTDDIRYQWAINHTDKRYLFLIHDDIKFFSNVAELYLNCFKRNPNLAIVGDFGGSDRCPYGPCGKKCSPEKILHKQYPSPNWPITGKSSIIHSLLGRYKRNCRINEWCCIINVDVARKIGDKEGIYFGNYEGGGDVATYWFDRIIKLGYDFTDPLPQKEERLKYYQHWWQGHMGHSVWVDQGKGKAEYEKEFIKKCILSEFNFEYR